MSTAYTVTAIVAATATLAAAVADFCRAQWILDNMTKYGTPHSWIHLLGAAKAAGAAGLLAGIAVPAIGVAAAVGLILFFLGAVITVARSRWYSHLPFPVAYLALSTAALVLLV